MKKTYLFLLLLSIFSIGREKKRIPFKPALEKIILEISDSLKNEMGKNKLLSIQFFDPQYDTDCNMRIFLSDWYASGSIDGYTKIGSTTIAIYNTQYDYYELVNKNAITYFTDTLIGFRDVCVWKTSEQDIILPQHCYSIHKTDSLRISSVPSTKPFSDFPYAHLIREYRCKGIITFTNSENNRFYWDSIQAEEGLRLHQEEVEHYRSKK